MYTYKLNEKSNEMIILLDGRPVYRTGVPEKNNISRWLHFEDCVQRLETQLI